MNKSLVLTALLFCSALLANAQVLGEGAHQRFTIEVDNSEAGWHSFGDQRATARIYPENGFRFPVVVTQAGKPLPTAVLWEQPEAYMDIIFDLPASMAKEEKKKFFVHMHQKPPAEQPPLKGIGGLVIETRWVNDLPKRTFAPEELAKQFNASTRIAGRRFVKNIHYSENVFGNHDNTNPFSEKGNLVSISRCKGTLLVEEYEKHRQNLRKKINDEEAELAKMPKDHKDLAEREKNLAAYKKALEEVEQGHRRYDVRVGGGLFLLYIDGTLLVRNSQHSHRGVDSGMIKLKPGAPASLDFIYADSNEGYGVSLFTGPSGGPYTGSKYLDVVENFLPVQSYHVSDFQREDGVQWPVVAWGETNYFMLPNVPDVVLARLEVANARKDLRYQWTFDDHQTTEGSIVEQLFFRMGSHAVKLTGLDSKGEKKLERTFKVFVTRPRTDHVLKGPDWKNINKLLSQIDPATMETSDLLVTYLFYSGAVSNSLIEAMPEWAGRCEQELYLKAKVVATSHPDQAFELAEIFKASATQRYDGAIAYYDALLGQSGIQKEARDRAALHKALLIMETQGANKDVLKLLDEYPSVPEDLKTEVLRARYLCKLALGDLKGSEEILRQKPTENVAGVDFRKEGMARLKTQGGIKHADSLCEMGSYDEALIRLWESWRGNPETLASPLSHLVLVKIHLGLHEFQKAAVLGDLLLKMETDDRYRPAVLAAVVESFAASGKSDDAKLLYKTLQDEYPVSPDTLKAKGKLIDHLSEKRAQPASPETTSPE
ncbi:MAG: hypothetical protein V4727_03375 [Verrucomicrobiota bacterium]